MKKFIVLLLALTMVVGAVFAQATVNGYVRSWGTYNSDAKTFDVANRLRLTLGWTSEDGNIEFGARIQNSDWTDPTDSFLVTNYAYGLIKLADGKVVISGGKLWNFDYDISSTGSDYAATGNVVNGAFNAFYFNNADGMLFQVLPVEGLNIGLLLRPDQADEGLREFGLGAKYSIADIGDIVFTAVGAKEIEDTDITASFAFTGVEGLFAAAGYKGLSTNGVYALVNYDKDAIFIEVAPEYNFTNETFYVEGLVKFTSGDLAIAGLFGYDSAPSVADTDGATANLGGPDTVGAAGNGYWVSAEVYYTFGKGQLVMIASYGEESAFSIGPVVKVSF